MKTTVYLSRKLLNQLKVKETESNINAQYKLFTVFDIMEVFDKLLISKKLGDFVPSGENRYRLYAKILSCLRSIREEL